MHLGICGYAGSGKDVVADILVNTFFFTKVNMSDALDEYLLALDPMINMDFDTGVQYIRYSTLRGTMNYVEAKKIPEVRRLLQKLGTEVGRSLDPDIWVKTAQKTIEAHKANGATNFVTTGIRYVNEATMVDGLLAVYRTGVGPANKHSSEDLREIFVEANYALFNDGTLEQFQSKAFMFGDKLINNSFT